jgi:hypothetical protein
VLRNRSELAGYWRAALAADQDARVRARSRRMDERRRELNVVYEANLNGERKRACEIMQFDAAGRQIRGEALYGTVL